MESTYQFIYFDAIIEAISGFVIVLEEAKILSKDNPEAELHSVEVNKLSNLSATVDEHANHLRKVLETIELPTLRENMAEANLEITSASYELQDIIESSWGNTGICIPRSEFDRIQRLLRRILKHLVIQIQITDQINVVNIMSTAKKMVDSVARMRNSETSGALVWVARDAAAVGIALQIQLNARLAEVTDGNLRQRLTDAMETVTIGVPVLLNACQVAVAEPTDENITQRDTSFKMVLEGLTEVVAVIKSSSKFVADYTQMFEFGDRLKKTPPVNALLTRLEQVVKKGATTELKDVLKLLGEAIAMQNTQTAEYMSSMQDDSKREQLQQELDRMNRLFKELGPIAEKACKDKTDQFAQQRFAQIVKQMRDANNNIANAKKIEKELMLGAKAIRQALANTVLACKMKDMARCSIEAGVVAENISRQVALARSIAPKLKDQARQQNMVMLCNTFEEISPKFTRVVREYIAFPTDKAKEAAVEEVVQQVQKLNARVAAEVLEDQLSENMDTLKSQIQQLKSEVKQGDSKKASEAMLHVAETLKRRIELGRDLASLVKDTGMKNQITGACDSLEKMLPELVLATKSCLQEPDEPSHQKRLDEISKEILKMAERTTANKKFGAVKPRQSMCYDSLVLLKNDPYTKSNQTRDTTAEEIISSHLTLTSDLDKLLHAVANGDYAQAIQLCKAILSEINKHIDLGTKLANECEVPVLKKQIQDAISELQSLAPQIVNTVKSIITNQGKDKKELEQLELLVKKTKDASKVIADAADKLRSQKVQIADIASNIKRRSSRIQSVEIRFEEKDDIMAAAQQVSKAARSAQEPAIPEQKTLLDIAANIAAAMARLSTAARNNSKKEMIKIARELAGMIAKIQGIAKEIASKCNDPILRDNLLSMAKVPSNFSIQLKIISAVKATSSDDDPTAETQLVTCAQGLANSVIQTVVAAEAASLQCV